MTAAEGGAADRVRCATRALKNVRYLEARAPQLVAAAPDEPGFGTGIPLNVLARLHRLSSQNPEVSQHERLASFLSEHQLPRPGRNIRGSLFNGTVFFVQITFHTPAQAYVIPDSDMSTIVGYATHAVVPISEYASQYGPNRITVSPSFLRYSVTLPGTSYSDADLRGWVDDIVSQNNLPSTCCVAVVSPQGVTAPGVGGNSGYHGLASVAFTVFGVYAGGLTLQDLPDVYAMVVSHEIAELVVDPNVDGQNPEVCDPCDLNCGPLHRLFFDDSDNYLGAGQALPPGFSYSYYICAIVNPGGAAACPAADGNCDYAPPPILHLGDQPEEWVKILFGVVNDAGGIGLIGGHPVPIGPWGPELTMLAGILVAKLANNMPGEEGQAVRAAAIKAVMEAGRQALEGG
jgi:hypothetical protein